MDLYPAIDIRDGGAVRLTQGDFDRQSDYGDPVDLARRFASARAPWLRIRSAGDRQLRGSLGPGAVRRDNPRILCRS